MARFAPLTLGQLGAGESSPAPPAQPVSARRRRRPQLARLVLAAQDVARRCRAVSVLAEERLSLSKGRLSVLRELEREGQQTVPELARALLVSRQHVQVLVNSLAESGYVKFAANPAHKRSRLVGLSSEGLRLVAELGRSERQLFETLAVAAEPGEVERAAELLGRVSSAVRAVRRRH